MQLRLDDEMREQANKIKKRDEKVAQRKSASVRASLKCSNVMISNRSEHHAEHLGWLYRDNLLCRGALQVRGHVVGPSNLSIPILAVVNVTDEVAPLVSVKPFIDAIPTKLARMIEYPGEQGVCLQHLGILVGRQAYANVWPEIISWLKDERAST
jgi:poly(3-hydroxyalkanoate) synthetase